MTLVRVIGRGALVCMLAVVSSGCVSLRHDDRPITRPRSFPRCYLVSDERDSPQAAAREAAAMDTLACALEYALEYALECALAGILDGASGDGVADLPEDALKDALSENLRYGLAYILEGELEDVSETELGAAGGRAVDYVLGDPLAYALEYVLADLPDTVPKDDIEIRLTGLMKAGLLEEALIDALAWTGIQADVPSICPINHPDQYVSSRFGDLRHAGGGRSRRHQGIDIVVPRGTPIVAAASGEVVFAGRCGAYGLLVRIDHANDYQTCYGHLDTVSVSKGDIVARGDEIGTVGRTGNATTAHLHYEVRENGNAVDPEPYLP
ncbi:MAG TPA: M23 family metallopeptidase [Candidatus Bathyarchaeia archaeon]|nr:M23 family metallopeptidase [Candidatus Bathyarchaeia archaeon]